jgi:hypothetical protein
MKLTNRAVVELRQALTALDGVPTPITVEGKTQVYLKNYEFSGSTRFKIGKNLSVLRPLAEVVEKSIDAVIRQYAVPKEGTTDKMIPQEKVAEYNAERETILDIETEVAITKLTEEDLKLDVNAIPGSVLSILSVMM